MSIPSIDFWRYSDDHLPPNKRLPKYITWMRALVWYWKLRFDIFSMYMLGANGVGFWDSTATYNSGDYAKNIHGVFLCVADGTTTDPNLDMVSWYKVLDWFIGATERTKYNGRYLSLTWALNRYFKGEISANGLPGFLQPPYPAPYGGGPAFSSIYITNEVPVYVSFAITDITQSLGAVSDKALDNGITDDSVIAAATSYGYTIHIPTVVYNSINSNSVIAENIVRQFVDQYSVSGTQYTIVTY